MTGFRGGLTESKLNLSPMVSRSAGSWPRQILESATFACVTFWIADDTPAALSGGNSSGRQALVEFHAAKQGLKASARVQAVKPWVYVHVDQPTAVAGIAGLFEPA